MKEEMIEKIVGFDIKVLTSKNEEKTIRITDIKTTNELNSTLSISDDWDRRYGNLMPFTFKVIEARIECFDYTITIE